MIIKTEKKLYGTTFIHFYIYFGFLFNLLINKVPNFYYIGTSFIY